MPTVSRTKKSTRRTVAPPGRIAKKPLAKKPLAKKQAAKKQAAKKPLAKKPLARKPLARKPLAREPLAKAKPVPRGKTKSPAGAPGSPLGHVVVADLMTSDPATVIVTASAGAALAKLHRLDVRHLPVVDEEGALVGMLSDRDFRPLPHDAESSRSPRPDTPVSDLMSSDVVSVEAETSARELIDLLLDQKVGALPVTDSDGSLCGIVSYIDVLRGLQGVFE